MRWTFPLLVLAAGLPTGLPAAPVPKDAGKLPPPTTEQLEASAKNLKAITLGVHGYASEYNDRIPNNTYDKDGKPLLSWRVHILPYVEETPLYKEFKLDEPWDSDHNKKLIPKMPKLYAPIRVTAGKGMTYYREFAGTGLFGPMAKYTIANIPDGTSNTGFVFEAAEPVVWTKPDGLPYEAGKPLPKLGGMFDGVCHVGLCDGTAFRMRKDPDAAELEKVIVPDDGHIVNLDKLAAK